LFRKHLYSDNLVTEYEIYFQNVFKSQMLSIVFSGIQAGFRYNEVR